MKSSCFRKYVILLIFSVSPLFSDDFSSQFNHYYGNKITHFKICGERCSGTNYSCRIFERNFPDIMNVDSGLISVNYRYGHKHYLCWFEHPYNPECRQTCSKENYYLNDTDHCLFIVVVRNVNDWLRSFYLSPWEVDSSMTTNGFSHFLQTEWKPGPHRRSRITYDTENPYSKKPFKNVLELRTCKHRNYLALGKKVKNYCLVRYEDVVLDPEGFVQFLSDFFGLQRSEKFMSVDDYKGFNLGSYVPKEYFPISVEDQQFIDDNLDLSWEQLVGY